MESLQQTNKEYLDEALRRINQVDSFLKKNNFNDYIVVGSCALLACGYPLNRFVHDIDIEVKCDKEQEKLFKIFSDAYNNNFYQRKEDYPEKVGFEHKPYIFKVDDISVNVWCVEKFTHSIVVNIGDIKFATLMGVMEKKLSYKRIEDINEILDFTTLLYNLWRK